MDRERWLPHPATPPTEVLKAMSAAGEPFELDDSTEGRLEYAQMCITHAVEMALIHRNAPDKRWVINNILQELMGGGGSDAYKAFRADNPDWEDGIEPPPWYRPSRNFMDDGETS